MEKKKIILFGDSIRMGYDKYVKEALADTADVYYPPENCRFAENLLRFAHEWKQKGEFPEDADIVHWNAGLWDALELFGDEPLSTLDYYASVIPRIDKRLRMLFPKATIVFATSTPVIEAKCSKDFKRHNSTIKKYNDTAVAALSGTDTKINDLFEFMISAPDEMHSDAVHFNNPLGTEYIGGRVVTYISELLGIAAEDINIENFSPEKYSTDNIGY